MIRLMIRLLGWDVEAKSAAGGGVRRFTPQLEVLGGRALPSAIMVASVDTGIANPDTVQRSLEWPLLRGQVTVNGGAAGGVTADGGALGGVIAFGMKPPHLSDCVGPADPDGANGSCTPSGITRGSGEEIPQ